MSSCSSPALPLPASAPLSHPHSVERTSHHISSQKHATKLITIRTRLSQLCRDGQPQLARSLFDTLPRPSTVLWNTIIIGLICNNMSCDALLFYARMKSSSPSIQFDSYTYSSALKACANSGCLLLGKAVHCHVLRCQTNPSRIVYNSLLNMYSTTVGAVSGKEDDLVYRVFEAMPKRNVVAWNTMVSYSNKTKRFRDAVRLFRRMMKTGIIPTPITFVNLFPAVSGLGDLNIANVLYGLIVKFGSEYVDDLFVVSSAIIAFAELGCVNFSRKIFDRAEYRNTEVWNTMIGAYVQTARPAEGIELLVQALECQLTLLDSITFISALTAASQLQWVDLGEQLHAHVIKNAMALHITVVNAIIVMYSRCNSIGASFKIFSAMAERDIVSWNTMVSAFVQSGFDDEGVMLVYEMQNQGFKIDSVTITALLSAASNLRNPDIGMQTHAYLLRHDIQLEGMDSYLIDMYAKSGFVNIARRLFDKGYSFRDLATWNSMISGYTQNEQFEEGFEVFREMLQLNVKPNSVTIASMLPACASVGNISSGKQAHGFAIRNCMDDNVYVGTSLVDMYSKCGAIAYAEQIFSIIPNKNSFSYTNMILGYGQHGMGEKALSLFTSMRSSGVEPDAITIVAILSSCSYAGMVDEGLQIFYSMEREYGIQPSVEHHCCVVDMLGRVGRLMDAYKFALSLGEECNTLRILGSLLGACKIHGAFELGKVVAQKLLQMEVQNGLSGYHVLLSNMYAEEGEWENVDKVRKWMRERGLKKEAGCSWIEIGGQVDYFLSRGNDHSQSDDIYETLENLTHEMKEAGYRPGFMSYVKSILEAEE